MELSLVRGPAAGITVEADDNLQDLVRTEAKDGSLRVWTDGSWTSKSTLKVTVTAPTFSGVAAMGAVRAKADVLTGGPGVVLLSAGGASQIDVGEVQGPGLKVSALGASNVAVGKSSPETVEVWASGRSKVVLHATCTKATVRAEGAASVGDANFKTKTADVMVTGTSSVDMDIAEKLQADATGQSSITYGGDPEVKGVSGAATRIEKRAAEKR